MLPSVPYLSSFLLRQIPEIEFGFSLKGVVDELNPLGFNLSLTVGEDHDIVWKRRIDFFQELGLKKETVAMQRQVHSDVVTVVDSGGNIGESDAMITNVPGLGLAISAADCTPLFLYDPVHQVIAGIHAGWKGAVNRIVIKTLEKMRCEFGTNPSDLLAYIGPSVSVTNYPVGNEVANQFPPDFIMRNNGSCYADVAGCNESYLLAAGVQPANIQRSSLCTVACKELLHSYRRDRDSSGRALGIIVMKGTS